MTLLGSNRVLLSFSALHCYSSHGICWGNGIQHSTLRRLSEACFCSRGGSPAMNANP